MKKTNRLFREFARFSVLSVLGSLGISCYILADTFFVSKGTGIEGLTALNLAIPVYNFIYGTGLMLGIGGGGRDTFVWTFPKENSIIERKAFTQLE